MDPAQPWSSIDASARKWGGRMDYEYDVSGDRPAPALQVNVWTKVQRWEGLDLGATTAADDDRFRKGAEGHTILVRLNPDGTVTVVQSDVHRGLRITTGGSWTGTAGLDGHSVGVLSLA